MLATEAIGNTSEGLANVAAGDGTLNPAFARSETLAVENIVNTLIPRLQTSEQESTAVAMNSSGNTVVTFAGKGPVDDDGVFARRFTSQGAALGDAFRVNTTTRELQKSPSVATDEMGRFLIAWEGRGNGDQYGIFAQWFDADGTPLGPETLVNTTLGGNQMDAAVAMADDGRSVVVWSGVGPDDVNGIYMQLFDADRNPVGGEVLVNTTTANQQAFPAVAMNSDGQFVVTWSSRHQDGSDWGIFGQRFDAAGGRVGGEFQLNEHSQASQVDSSVGIADDGSFAVAWSGFNNDGTSWNIYARRFDEDGQPLGEEQLVNESTEGVQKNADLSMTAAGNYALIWTSGVQDGSGWEVFGRVYTFAGEAQEVFPVNTVTTGFASGHQDFPAIAVGNGQFAFITWSGRGVLDHDGVFRRPFEHPGLEDCEFGEGFTELTIAEGGGSLFGHGDVVEQACGVVMTEGDSFLVALEMSFEVPSEPTAVQFSYEDLNFDTSDPYFINDAFEVAIVDGDGNSLVKTIGPGRDAFFNITEELGPAVADGVIVDGQTITVGLNGIPVGTSATLILRLANDDDDTETSVFVTDVQLIDSDLEAVPPGGASSLGTLTSAPFNSSSPSPPQGLSSPSVSPSTSLRIDSQGVSDSGISISASAPGKEFPAGQQVLLTGTATTQGAVGESQVISFESVPGTATVEGSEISDQFLASQGVSFKLEGGGFPVLAEVGSPLSAFEGPQLSHDTPAPDQGVDSFFLTDDGTVDSSASPIVVEFRDPVSSVSGDLLDIDSEPGQFTVFESDGTPGYYNDSIGTLLNGTSSLFPASGDPTINNAPEPDLTAASAVLGNWLSDDPLPLNANWSFQSIPTSWPLQTETAIVYEIDGGPGGVTNLRGNFGVDNGIFVWLNGEYKFGALAPGSVGRFEYPNIDLGDLLPGKNYLQVLREDHGSANGFAIQITGELVPADAWLVEARDAGGTTIDQVVLDPTSPNAGDGLATRFSLDVSQPEIKSLRISYAGNRTSSIGFGLDNLSYSTGAAQADISHVLVNGTPVDVLDAAGNFFEFAEIQPGENVFEFTAFDTQDRSASTALTITGTTRPPGEIDFSRFADITGSFSGVYSRTSFNEATKQLHVNLATRNDGAFEADVPLLVGVKNISDPTVSVVGADGTIVIDGQGIAGQPTTSPSVSETPLIAEIGETGQVTFSQTNAGNWQTVTLNNAYADPVVIAQSLSFNGPNPSTVRIRNVTGTRFQIQIDEWDYLDGAHAAETVNYVVMERGMHVLPDGTIAEAGTVDTNHEFATVNFTSRFDSTPVVLSQSQTVNGPSAIVTRQHNVSTDGFRVRVQEEEGQDGPHAVETVGFIALEAGGGSTGDAVFEARRTPDNVTDQFSTISFGQSFDQPPLFVAGLQTFDGADPAGLRYRNLQADNVQVFVEEETSGDAEVVHTSEVVGYFAFGAAGTIRGQTIRTVGETGQVTFSQPNLGKWQKVLLRGNYLDPVVIAQPPSFNGPDPATVRIRNVTGTSFEIQIREWDYLDGAHTAETVSFLVFEAGAHSLEDGTKIFAGSQDVNHKFVSVDLSAGAFASTPVVLSQSQTYAGPSTIVARQRHVNPSSFEVRLQEEENNDGTHAVEKLGFIAIEAGAGTSNSIAFEAGLTGEVTHASHTLTFDGAYTAPPLLLAGMQTYNGPDTAAVRYDNLSGTSVDVFVEEEASFDGELFHVAERVGYFAFASAGVFTSGPSPVAGPPLVEPAPPEAELPEVIPYYDYTDLVAGGKLQPGELTGSPTVSFHNPERKQFDYELVFFGKLNEAPQITSLPDIEALAGQTYSYDTEAVDPDGDVLTYSLSVAPSDMAIDPTSGLISWTTDSNDIGLHDIAVRVEDGRGGVAEQQYTLSVIPAPPNRPPVIVSTPETQAAASAIDMGDPEPFDLSNWEVVQFPDSGNQGPGNWVLESNTSVIQTRNANASLLVGPELPVHAHVEGTWSVETAHDDDSIGFVFGYQDARHFYVVNWIQGTPPDQQGGVNNATPGLRVIAVHSSATTRSIPQGNNENATTLYHNDAPTIGWEDFTEYTFVLDFHPGIFSIEIRDGNTVVDSFTIKDDTYTSGRFGFFNHSQGQVAYSGFNRQATTEITYEYDVAAIDPDDDVLAYSLVQAPAGMRIDRHNGLISWGPVADQIGNHQVRVEVTDGRGGVARQEFVVCVHGDPDNRAPSIISDPITDYQFLGFRNPLLGDVDPQRLSLSLSPGDTSTQSLTLDVPAIAAGQAEVVFVVDESGSMTTEHDWLGEMIFALDQKLAEAEIDDVRYGLVGYTGSARSFTLGDGLLGSAQEFATATDSLRTSGGTEDGYRAIDFVFQHYPFREGAAVNIVVVTDEDRDRADGGITFETVLAELEDVGGLLNSVINGTLRDGADASAVGVDAEGNAYLADGSGGFTLSPGGHYTSAAGSTEADYIELAWAANGATWDLNQLRAGGDLATSFTDAFVSIKAQEIQEQLTIDVIASDPEITVENLTGVVEDAEDGQPVSFDVRITAPDRPASFDLAFIRAGTSEIIASIPTTINYDYSYPAQAVDPDNDPLTWSLVEGPRGLTIDPEAGSVNWDTRSSDFAPISSNFSEGDEGWTGINGVTVAYRATGGEPGGFMRFNDTGSGSMMAVAPDKFHGDLSLFDGGTVSFDSKAFDVGNGQSVEQFGRLTIFNGANSATIDVVPGSLTTQWTTYSAMLTADAAGVSQQDWEAILADVTGMQLDLEAFHSNEGIGLDNFTISGGLSGQHNVTIRVADNRGGYDEQSYTITIDDREGTGEIRGTKFEDLNASGVRDVVEIEVFGSDVIYLAGRDDVTIPPLGSTDPTFPIARHGFVSSDFIQETFPPSLPVSAGDVIQVADPAIGGIHFFKGPGLPGEFFGPEGNGDAGSGLVAVGGLSGYVGPEGPLAGLFLDDSIPSTGPAPETLDFSSSGIGTDFLQLSPQLGQVFYIGDGLNSAGNPQQFIAPAGATRLFIGIPDGSSFDGAPGFYEDNNGSYRVRIGLNQSPHGPAVPEGPLSNWIIYLDQNNNGMRDPGERFTLTDQNGDYEFTGLPTDTYIVREEVQAGWQQTLPGDGSYVVPLPEDEIVDGVDFGNVQVSTGPNLAPEITSTPVTLATATEVYRYDATAEDPENEPVSFSLLSEPDGMTVHPDLGVVVWQPTQEQVGNHDVLLSVRDSSGEMDVQAFTVSVTLPNTSPVITSSAPEQATVDHAYEYRVAAQDADGDLIQFRLGDNVPVGITVDPSTGVVSWTPGAADVGTHSVTVIAFDEFGESSQTYDLEVVASAANGAPEIHSAPRTVTRHGDTWAYMIEAHDPNGDPLSYHLDVGPADMAIGPDGLVLWTPAADDIGQSVPVEIRVADGRNGETIQQFNLSVLSQQVNAAPQIISTPPPVATLGNPYQYDAVAADPDQDVLMWSLETAPLGMSIDPMRGTIRWTPDDQQLGEHVVVVTAQDPYLATSTQRFVVDVRCNNTAPAIVSIPPTQAIADRNYLYPVRAEDLEGDALTFALTEAPDGMTVDAQTGLIRWLPSTAQLGPSNVVVEVTDLAGGTNTQSYTVVVSAADAPSNPNDPNSPPIGNRAPVITSTPVFNAEVDTLYQYDVSALDPDGDAITFSLDAPPTGLTIDPGSGLITWTPGSTQTGQHLIAVVAEDDPGAVARQSFLVEVTQNSPPAITSVPIETAVAGATYRYTVRANDPDGDPLQYSLQAAPAGMTIDQLGRIFWQPGAADVNGPHNVEVVVTDDRGQTDSQSFGVNVMADDVAPQVSITVQAGSATFANGATVDVGSDVTFFVAATDNVGVEQLALTVDGQNVPLDANGQATIATTEVTQLAVRATATDAAGNEGEAETNVDVIDPANANQPVVTDPSLPPHPGFDPSDNQHPIVTITSPEPATTVTNVTPIIGTVDDPEDNLWYYRVYYARSDRVELTGIDLDDPDWIMLSESTQEVIDGELAVFDPSMASNDPYAIIVAAFDGNGQGFVQPTLVVVEGNVQLGNFRLEFTDLSVPLAGVPISVTRVYDTVNAQDEGDFGFGWMLGVQDARILEVAAIGPGGAFNPGNDKFVPDKTKVYLTNPDGQRVGFTYKEQLISASFFGAIWRPYFEADPGVYDTLEIDETQVARGGLVGTLSQGINPNNYTLTTKDGLKYRYNETAGLQTITDRNGNVVTFTDSGVQHSSGQSIDFVRDHRGRIVEIVDPAGNSIVYEYDVAGDLTTVTNQSGLETNYTYLNDPSHYLDEAFDSLGKRVLKAVYEENPDTGQIEFKGVIDASGNRIDERDFDTDQNTGIVRDANGNATTLLYDDRGNVLEETDPLGNTTFYEYNDPQNPDLETRIIDRRGMVTDRQYDARGNLTTIAERGPENDPFADPIVTSFTYDSTNQVTSITNTLNATTTFQYDASDNLTQITNAENNSSFFTYDSQGRRTTFTDFNGNTTAFAYNGSDQPTMVTFADGTYQMFAYNQFGQVTLEEIYETDDTLVERRRTKYDNTGRVTEEISGADGDPEHPATIVRRFYDGHLLDYEVIVHPDSLDLAGVLLESPATPVDQRESRITDFEYDVNDRLIRQTDAEGGVVDFRYDASGNRVLLRDPVGNITTWIYDGLNRVVEERDPFYWVDVRNSDPALASLTDDEFLEQVAPVVLTAGADPLYDDPSGADCATNTGVPHVTLTCYDEESNLAKEIDRNGRRREFEYDHAGRLLNEDWFNADSSPERTINFTYDAVGNMLTASDPDSNYAFAYDGLNRLVEVDNNPDGTRDVPRVILTYGYDAQGNVTLTQDDSGVTVESTYNRRNLLETRKWFDSDGSGDVDHVRVDFQYNAAGREAEIRRYSDLNATNMVGRTVRNYDLAGRSDLLTHLNALDEVLAGYDYNYDFSGLLIGEERTHQDAQFAQSITYDYDLTGQLIDAVFSGQDNEHYEYDANGNRLSSQVGSEQRTYTTGTANQLEADSQFRYDYDGEGNQIKRIDLTTGETRTFEYDHRNRLVRVDDWSSDPGDPNDPDAGAILTQSVEYTYDALARRIARSLDGDGGGPQSADQEFFVYYGDNVWADFSDASQIGAYYLFGNEIDENIARVRSGGGTMWYLGDQLGTIRDVADTVGQLSNHNQLSTFGALHSQTDVQFEDRFLFTGREFDASTRLLYFRARFFESSLGRFISQDPRAFEADDFNLFRYVNNSPLNGNDPTGEISLITTARNALSAIRARFATRQAACASVVIFTIVSINIAFPSSVIANEIPLRAPLQLVRVLERIGRTERELELARTIRSCVISGPP